MLRHLCKMCRTSLHTDDTHAEGVSCLGESHADAALSGGWLLSLRVQSCLSALADSFLFRERLRPSCPFPPPPRFLPLRDLWGKNSGQRIWVAGDKRAHVCSMPACLAVTPERESIRPSSSLNMISVPPRLRATWSHSVRVTAKWMTAFLMRSSSASWQRLSMSSGSKGLRLRSHLAAGWTSVFSRVGPLSQPPPQRSSPFFPEVHDELTISWNAPHSSCIRPSASAALTSVDGAEEKGYERLPPIAWKAKAGELSVQAVHLHSLDRPTRWLDKRHLRYNLQLCFRSSRPRCSPVRKPVRIQLHSGTWGARQTWPCAPLKPLPKPLEFDVQPGSVRAPPLAQDNRDVRGGQSSLPRRSGFVREPVWNSCGGLCGTLHGGSEITMRHFLPKSISSSAACSHPSPAPTAKPTSATLEGSSR